MKVFFIFFKNKLFNLNFLEEDLSNQGGWKNRIVHIGLILLYELTRTEKDLAYLGQS
jgi:hypothetical protein